ncbi:beta-lactamase family protein [Ideonella sp. 4Y11]|uniref:Beta-lactamase family protein n=1 Tax=Ideonella aquatica TaxID=2824119 RepID=A0A940YF94_9BURK|nr:serine hydrolase domain-containing protein [Ideonella aquatica]MBQ0959148.1 beta-lactamase family protein [Ideonella aquatica]
MLPESAPPPHPLSEPTPALARLDRALAERAVSPQAPGFALAWLQQGQVLRRQVQGCAHLEWDAPLTEHTRFYLASEAKPWVAALVLQAVADGQLDLMEDLRAQLPALAEVDHPVRIGHALRHTSGLPDYLALWHAQLAHHENDLVDQAQALALIARSGGPRFVPGERYEYSNSNYVLLAERLQQISGLSLAELAQQRLFGPWGLRDTGFERDPWRVLPRRARSYARDPAGAWRDQPVPLGSWGDGGLWSTLADLERAEAAWWADWQARGPHSLLARAMADDARFAPPGQSYRFGLEVLPRGGHDVVFHGGAYAGFRALCLRRPATGEALLVLSNRDEDADTSAPDWMNLLWP